jgi:hypothetical protein
VKKLLLQSVLFATILIPALASGQPNPRLALKRALFYWVIFNVVYAFLLVFVYGRLD